MSIEQLKEKLANLKAFLFREEYLDDQFNQLQQDENPDFINELLPTFMKESERLSDELTKAIYRDDVDFKHVGDLFHQAGELSASIGAQRMLNACNSYHRNPHSCRYPDYYVSQFETEMVNLNGWLTKLISMEKQIKDIGNDHEAGGSSPPE